MPPFVIPLELVLQLVTPEHAVCLEQLRHGGAQVQCMSTLERSVTGFSLRAQVGEQSVQTGTHPWIAEPLVEELFTLLAIPPAPTTSPHWQSH